MQKISLALVAALLLAVSPMIASAADAASKGGHDTANVKVVNDFLAAWADPAKAAEYLSEKAVVRMEEDKPAITGRQPFIDAFKSYFQAGMGITVKTLDTYARGPVVVNQRVDTLTTKDKPDQPFKVIGVFVVKDGKIAEWTDYLEK